MLETMFILESSVIGCQLSVTIVNGYLFGLTMPATFAAFLLSMP